MTEMTEMIKAEGIEAIFEGHDQRTDKPYTFRRPVEFWYSDNGMPQGMYIDDNGSLMSAESRTNFKGYLKGDTAPIVGVIPGGDLYAVYRDDDGTLNRTDIPALLVGADGELTVREFDSDGAGYNVPTDASNFVGYWRKSWGDEPIAWKPEEEIEDTGDEGSFGVNEAIAVRVAKQGRFFEASGGSPPEDE
jgi:hypothetical protein